MITAIQERLQRFKVSSVIASESVAISFLERCGVNINTRKITAIKGSICHCERKRGNLFIGKVRGQYQYKKDYSD